MSDRAFKTLISIFNYCAQGMGIRIREIVVDYNGLDRLHSELISTQRVQYSRPDETSSNTGIIYENIKISATRFSVTRL